MRRASAFLKEDTLDIINRFIDTYKNKRTGEEYFSYICLLCDYLKKDYFDIQKNDAAVFFEHLNNRFYNGSISIYTIRVRLNCYNSFTQFIQNNYPQMEYRNPFYGMKLPDVNTKVDARRIPSMYEMDEIIGKAKEESYMVYLIVALALRVGLTASRIASLSKKNIVSENGAYYLFYPNKYDSTQDKYIKLPSDVSDVLIPYIESQDLCDSYGHIFYNRLKKPVTVRNIDSYINQVISKSNVAGKYTIKDFRNRGILDMIDSGADVDAISEYVGISKLWVGRFAESTGVIGECPADLVNYRLLT